MRPSLFTSAEPYLELFRAFFTSREAREQRALKILGVFLIFALFYGLWILPMHTHLQSLRVEIQRDEKTLSWMEGVDRGLSTSQKTKSIATVSTVDVLSHLQKIIQASPLASGMSSLKQIDDHVIDVQFNNVSFDEWIKWISQLEMQLPLKMSNLTVNTTNLVPGMVNIDLKLALT